MQSILKNKTILAILFVLVVVFVIYFVFKGGQSASTTATNALLESSSGSTPSVGAEFVARLSQLERLTIDGSVFNDPVFKSLHDLSTPIPPQQEGRNNPFSPIGIDASSPASSGAVSSSTKASLQGLQSNPRQ